MANQEHLDILKQGVEVWNKWRKEHPRIHPNLRRAILTEANLDYANLSESDLTEANLFRANLIEANLSGANLSGAILGLTFLNKANLFRADLTKADLAQADLNRANLTEAILAQAELGRGHLRRANLTEADLTKAHLGEAILAGADLSGAILTEADLTSVDLSEAILRGTNLSEARIGLTIFGNVDLSVVKGLETVEHYAPSTIGIDTILNSRGKIPEIFLRESGVPPSIIEAIPSLIGSLEPIQYYTCFISYSSKDQDFAQRLYNDLQGKGVRCWFAPEDLKIGEKFWHRIDESIRLYDKLLVVLSEHSVTSVWVENEVMAAMEKEHQQQKLVLFPIKLDETVMQTSLPWAANMRRTRHIGDFTDWKNHDDYQKGLTRLLRDLKAST